MPEQHTNKNPEAFIFDSQYLLASTSGVKQLLNERLYYRDLHAGVVETPFPTASGTTGDERAVSVRNWYDNGYRCVSWWRVGFTVDHRGGRGWINNSIVIPVEDYQTIWCCPAATKPLYQTLRTDAKIIELIEAKKSRYGDNAAGLASSQPVNLDSMLSPLKNEDVFYKLDCFDFAAAAKDYKDILTEALAGILASKKVYIIPRELPDERIRLGCLLSATVPTLKGRDLTLITHEPRPGLWDHYQVVIGLGNDQPDDERVVISKERGGSRAEDLEHKTAAAIVEKLIKDGMQALRGFYTDLYFS